MLVSTKLDTKFAQFGRADELEAFLAALPLRRAHPALLGGPFFTSVPAGTLTLTPTLTPTPTLTLTLTLTLTPTLTLALTLTLNLTLTPIPNTNPNPSLSLTPPQP